MNNNDNLLEKICQSAFNGDINELKILLLKDINLNQVGKNWTPLHSAIENENTECVKLLIEKGADIEYMGMKCMGTPLDHAVDISVQSNNNTGGKPGNENLEIISILLEAGANTKAAIITAEDYDSKKIIDKLKKQNR